ncbi:MAG: 2-phosphosulfolactate phosphatase [bacterium]|nr:2-phosphosulfolactate phosphatase [bacterium]
MKIDVYLIPDEIAEERLKDKTAVVVDVLRASTTICAALSVGARAIIPADSISSAIQLASLLSRSAVLLCGEREGKLIEGFDLANSPFEYTRAKIKGKTLIFGSTNGSPTIIRTRQARHTVICGFVNLDVVVEALAEITDPINILCSGKFGQFAIEDAICAGRVVAELQKLNPSIELNDGAIAAKNLAEYYWDRVPEIVAGSHHGQYLTQIGMDADLPFCSDLNRVPVLPVFHDGKITLAK